VSTRERVVVTGVTGTLGAALARTFRARGCEVVGVSRRVFEKEELCDRAVRNDQRTVEDARALAFLHAVGDGASWQMTPVRLG